MLATYDESLVDADSERRRQWARGVLASLDTALGDMRNLTFEIHAGAAYRDFGLTDGLTSRGARVECPTAGLRQGEQLAFYGAGHPIGRETHTEGGSGLATTKAPIPAIPTSSRGVYAPLGEHLATIGSPVHAMSFAEIEQVLGRPLPASARRHSAWWANDRSGGHSHALAWLANGWVTEGVDLDGASVRFARRSGGIS